MLVSNRIDAATADLDRWVEVTTLDDVWEGEMVPFDVQGIGVLIVNSEGHLSAFEDRCPHVANPLSTGVFDGTTIMCAAHQWTFTAKDGAGINPAISCIRRFDLKIEGDAVLVNVGRIVQEAKGMA